MVGRSLGGAVSVHTATKYPHLFRGVVLENTFTSIPDMVDELFFFAKYFKRLILNNHWPSIDHVGTIRNPLLFITGDRDELVPQEMTVRLHAAAKSSAYKQLYVVKDGTHSDTWYVGGNNYLQKLKKFFDKALGMQQVMPKKTGPIES